jgi:predicted DNA-binding protein (UPF0278 family)
MRGKFANIILREWLKTALFFYCQKIIEKISKKYRKTLDKGVLA